MTPAIFQSPTHYQLRAFEVVLGAQSVFWVYWIPRAQAWFARSFSGYYPKYIVDDYGSLVRVS